MAATNLFGNIINIHPFEGGNGRICHLILAHVLRQKTLHKAIRMLDRKPSNLYTMIVKPLINCWDNFEQNAKMLN